MAAIRLRGDEVIAACGGDPVAGRAGARLRRAVLDTLKGALPVFHDPPGARRALEAWLGQALELPLSLRVLARKRAGLPALHDLATLAGRLGLDWRETEDPLEQADLLWACMEALRRPGESLEDLRNELSRGARPLDWSQYAFDRQFLDDVPSTPGTYRFYDRGGKLLYVGKSKNLHRRLQSYFREGGSRSARVQKLVDAVHHIEFDATGSDLEATLREAALIRTENPEHNVQREISPRRGRANRARSMLILEPSAPPAVLKAYLIQEARLIDAVAIGPRGGGLRRIARMLDDYFFSAVEGPTAIPGPDLDVELIVRWLAEHRDRVVASTRWTSAPPGRSSSGCAGSSNRARPSSPTASRSTPGRPGTRSAARWNGSTPPGTIPPARGAGRLRWPSRLRHGRTRA